MHFLFESAVMDGAPVFSLRAGARGCRVTGISGILNTTTNFVISRLEKGESMASAVQTAQELGFAEADPSLDLEGWDAAAKTAILANVFLDAGIDPLAGGAPGHRGPDCRRRSPRPPPRASAGS